MTPVERSAKNVFFVAKRSVWAFAGLGAIVLVYHRWVEVNPTTVALTLLLYVLFLAARLSLRYAVVVSIAATGYYNFYFLPPYGTFRIADKQNWVALLAFFATSVVGSRLSQRARDEAEEARTREREVEVLFRLSRELLRAENVSMLIENLPRVILHASGADRVAMYLLKGELLSQAGHAGPLPDVKALRHLTETVPEPERGPRGEVILPLKAGSEPSGVLLLHGVALSGESFAAIGGLVSAALARAEAVEALAREEAGKESERLRTLILDSITHELRTPLTSIKGATSALLTTQGMAEDDRHELLTIVDEESDRLNRLISRAVEMAELESHQVRMTFEPAALDGLLDEAREACGWVERVHPLTVDVPAGLEVMADAELLRKAICNLIENAAKYSPDGAPILVTGERHGAQVLLRVRDQGAGIDVAEQALVFERFYRGRMRGEGPSGTGMGLTISRAIVESHGGTLTVKSVVGQGSVFTMALPLRRADAVAL